MTIKKALKFWEDLNRAKELKERICYCETKIAHLIDFKSKDYFSMTVDGYNAPNECKIIVIDMMIEATEKELQEYKRELEEISSHKL